MTFVDGLQQEDSPLANSLPVGSTGPDQVDAPLEASNSFPATESAHSVTNFAAYVETPLSITQDIRKNSHTFDDERLSTLASAAIGSANSGEDLSSINNDQSTDDIQSECLSTVLSKTGDVYTVPSLNYWDRTPSAPILEERRHAILLRHFIDHLAPEVRFHVALAFLSL